MCGAIKDGFEDTRAILEPAGELAIAGTKAYAARTGVRGQTLVAVASGANMNFDRLRFVAEVAENGEQREAIIAFSIPERPGALLEFLNALSCGWNISLFHYRNHGADYGRVLAGLQIPPQEKRQFESVLRRLGYRFSDKSRNPACRLFLG